MGVLELVKKQERELGIELGLEQGRMEERAKTEARIMKMARSMKEEGLSLEQISKFTKLSVAELRWI